MTMWTELDKRLPIAEIAANFIISKMGDITAALELTKPEIFTLSRAEYDCLHQAYVKGLKLMPSDTVFLQQDTYWKDQYHSSDTQNFSFLAGANEHFFIGRSRIRHFSRIYLTLKPHGRQSVTSATSSLLRSTLVPSDTLDPDFVADFGDKVRQFIRVLEDTGLVHLRRIPASELSSTSRSAGEV
jgi:hypothetical protein